MAARIERLVLKHFRGASVPLVLEFDKQKQLVLIFGENGTGKSAIADAFDFVCNGGYGCLDDRSLAGRKQQHVASIGSGPADVEVSLDAGGQTWKAHLASTGPSTAGPAGRPGVAVLRRSQVLRVINEQPKQRYDALREFVGLPGVQQSEDSLRRALKDRVNEYDAATLAKQDADDALQRLWKAEGSPGTGAQDWARNRVADNPDRLVAAIGEADGLLSLFSNASSAWDGLAKARKAHEAVAAELIDAQAELAKAEAASTAGSSALVDLLTDAQRLLGETGDPGECPLCESSDRASGLRGRVASRLAELRRLVELKEKAAGAQGTAERAGGALDTACRSFTSTTRQFGLRLRSRTPPPHDSLVIWAAYDDLLGPKVLPPSGELLAEAERLWQEVREQETPIRTARDTDQRNLNQLSALKQYIGTIDEKTGAARSLEAITKALRTILATVEGQRKTYVDGLLGSVSTAVEAMYAKVHPGEDIGKVRLFLKPSVAGSLEFTGDFQGTASVPPQAYYSDSHLDTLGACIFLALANQSVETRVVVLDDVLTSADGPHADRFFRMLQDEVPHFDQIIVTTHYRPWRERHRHVSSATVQLIELGPWSLSRGIWPAKTKPKLDEIASLLAGGHFDRQALASKAGILLEELLDFVCLRFGCRVPRKAEPAYTLGELASAVGKLSKVLAGC